MSDSPDGKKTSAPKQSVEYVQRSDTIAIAKTWQGPLPDPISLEHYKKVDPALVDLVIHLAKSEQEGRLYVSRTEADVQKTHAHGNNLLIQLESKLALRGQIFSFSIILLSIAAAVASYYYLGSLALSGMCLITPVGIGLVRAFMGNAKLPK